MKRSIVLLLVFTSVSATIKAQSLKDILYGGKLKSDSGTVVRKTDDLSTKIDTSRKKPVEPEKAKLPVVNPGVNVVANNNANQGATTDSSKVDGNTPKDNTKTWNSFVDAVVDALKTEVLNSKKIKKGDYSVMVDYVIDVTGKVTISNVFVTPESKFLQEQVQERLGIDTPVLNPVLGSNGKPRKVNKRTSFALSKN